MTAILLKPMEVADLLGLSRSKVFEMIAAEELPVVRFGRAVRVPREELDSWIRLRTRSDAKGLLGRLHDAIATNQG